LVSEKPLLVVLPIGVTADDPASIWHIDSEAGRKVMRFSQWLGLAAGAALVIAGLALCFAAAL
jgi:predicted lysophospholipase L1 biosynthesis ABC-type transport system permease subunit